MIRRRYWARDFGFQSSRTFLATEGDPFDDFWEK